LAVQIFSGAGFLNNFRSKNVKVRDYLESLDAVGDAVKVCDGVVWVSDLAYGLLVDCCEHGDETSCSKKGGVFE
jgi:hypothetical protein